MECGYYIVSPPSSALLTIRRKSYKSSSPHPPAHHHHPQRISPPKIPNTTRRRNSHTPHSAPLTPPVSPTQSAPPWIAASARDECMHCGEGEVRRPRFHRGGGLRGLHHHLLVSLSEKGEGRRAGLVKKVSTRAGGRGGGGLPMSPPCEYHARIFCSVV